jgi:hypothetical protein
MGAAAIAPALEPRSAAAIAAAEEARQARRVRPSGWGGMAGMKRAVTSGVNAESKKRCHPASLPGEVLAVGKERGENVTKWS